MFLNISGNNADVVWRKAARKLLQISEMKMQNSRLGYTSELMHVSMTVKSPRDRWVYSRHPAMNPSFALAELVWIMNGANEADVINFWNPQLSRFAGNGRYYHGAYGFRLKFHFGLDQLIRAYNALDNNPESRQVVLQIWDAKIDLPHNNGKPMSQDIPCNICSVLKIRNNKLDWLQIVRSNDIYLGLPYNFVQFTSMQEILAGWLGIEMGDYHQVSDSLHLYKHDKSKIKISQTPVLHNSDNLSLSMNKFNVTIKHIYANMKKLTDPLISQKQIEKLSNISRTPEAYRNIMLMIGADVARRKKWPLVVTKLISNSSNTLYQKLWFAWEKRNYVGERNKLV